MQNRDVVIICRSKPITVDQKKSSLPGFLVWGSHLKQKHLIKHLSENDSPDKLKAKIESNVQLPEWIGNHRFGLFDLLNYVKNSHRYVYDPGVNPDFFNPIGIPSATSLCLFDYLLKNDYNPINLDNVAGNSSRLKKIFEKKPLAVVISATLLNVEQIQYIIQFIRMINKEVPIIIGSSYLLTRCNSNGKLQQEYEQLISPNVYLILDEYGQEVLHSILQMRLAGEPIKNVPGTVYLGNDALKYTERRNFKYEIDADYPDWSNVSRISNNVAFIRGSQGCPFKCKFCSFPKASVKIRHRSVESIREEMKKIEAAGITNIAFSDDHFAITPKRITEICHMLLQEKFHFNWFAGIRANTITPENTELLEATGCKVVCIGLESGDDRILNLINKQTTTAGNMKCLEILDKHNIIAYGSFILGFPGETEESFNNTINWINQSPLKLYKVFLFHLFPDSIIYDEQAEHHITFMGDSANGNLWKTPTMNALRASELIKDFILKVNHAALIYNYSPMYAFFPFLSKGYSMTEGLNFFRLRTELIKNELSNIPYLSKRKFRKNKLTEIEKLLR